MTISKTFKRATIRVSQLSALFSLLLIVLLVVISCFYYEKMTIAENEKQLNHVLNSLDASLNSNSYLLLLNQLRMASKIEDVHIFSKNCDLLASDSWKTEDSLCRRRSKNFIYTEFQFQEKQIIIAYRNTTNYVSMLRNNFTILASTFISFFIVSLALLLFYTYITFIKPMQRLRNSLGNTPKDTDDFGFFCTKLNELKDEIIQREHEKAFFELARTVVHDIRNPLDSITSMLETSDLSKKKIERKVTEIRNQVDSILMKKNQKQIIESIKDLLTETTNDAAKVFPVEIRLELNFDNRIQLPLSEIEFKNLFFNLIKNSYEASSRIIKIQGKATKDNIEFNVSDDGIGINQELKDKLFIRDFTTKYNGNGIGLSAIRDLLLSIGGNIEFDHIISQGCSLKVTLPIRHKESSAEIILIDDDKFIHQSWKSAAEKANVKIHSFMTFEDFHSNQGKLCKSLPVYIDSDLKGEGKGEYLSKSISDFGFGKIYLATAYQDLELADYPWINAIITKSPPFVNVPNESYMQ